MKDRIALKWVKQISKKELSSKRKIVSGIEMIICKSIKITGRISIEDNIRI